MRCAMNWALPVTVLHHTPFPFAPYAHLDAPVLGQNDRPSGDERKQDMRRHLCLALCTSNVLLDREEHKCHIISDAVDNDVRSFGN